MLMLNDVPHYICKSCCTGVKGAFYAGHWVDIEDCVGTFQPDSSKCSQCPTKSTCPRSQSRNAAVASSKDEDTVYDVVIIGAGCIGSAIARELSRYSLKTLLLESADDVSQGATKGNSGIVHAGYDDKPGSLHAKFCWPGKLVMKPLVWDLSISLSSSFLISILCVLWVCLLDCEGNQMFPQLGELKHAYLTEVWYSSW